MPHETYRVRTRTAHNVQFDEHYSSHNNLASAFERATELHDVQQSSKLEVLIERVTYVEVVTPLYTVNYIDTQPPSTISVQPKPDWVDRR